MYGVRGGNVPLLRDFIVNPKRKIKMKKTLIALFALAGMAGAESVGLA